MRTILLIAVLLVGINVCIAQTEAEKIDKEFALSSMLLLDGFEYKEAGGNIYYAIDTNDALNHLGTIVSRDKAGKVVLDYDQLHPITFQAIKEMNTTNIRLKEEIDYLHTLIQNLDNKLNNEIQQTDYEIEFIKSEIAP